MLDPYITDSACVERLIHEYRTHKSLVIAYDFDDTVYDFHKKGRVYPTVIELLRRAKQYGCYLIVWTGNEDTEFIKTYLDTNQIPYDAINEHPPFWKQNNRKVYANIYLDDRAGLSASVLHLQEVLKTIEAD